MAFPDEIVTFPQMKDITASDGEKIRQYQIAMQSGDTATASAILATIPEYTKKILTAAYMNSIVSTVNAMEIYLRPVYVVSATQPANQQKGDFWFQITG